MAEDYILVFRVERRDTRERVVEMSSVPVEQLNRESMEAAFNMARRFCNVTMEEAGILAKYDPVAETIREFQELGVEV